MEEPTMPALNTTTDSARMPHAIQPAVPTEQASAQALALGRILEFILKDGQDLVLTSSEDKTQAAVPVQAARMLLSILDQTERGNPVTVVPLRKELSAQQAADILRVSRPFLIQLLKDGKIPYRMVGTHHRLTYEDVAEYDRMDCAERDEAFSELVKQAQELNMGY